MTDHTTIALVAINPITDNQYAYLLVGDMCYCEEVLDELQELHPNITFKLTNTVMDEWMQDETVCELIDSMNDILDKDVSYNINVDSNLKHD